MFRWRGYGETVTHIPATCNANWHNASKVLSMPDKLRMLFLFDPEILLLRIYPEDVSPTI